MLPRLLAPRLPVWLWRAAMSAIGPLERRRFERGASRDVVVEIDIDYVGRGCVEQRLDVIVPRISADRPAPVYVYFHGGGWTSGSKRTVGSYCAAQAEAGLVVVNVEYRKAPKATMSEMLRDGTAALAWVADHIAEFNGDPHRLVLGGDSAGGQLAGLLAQISGRTELAAYWDIEPALASSSIRGVVQHCAALDLSVVFEQGFIMGQGFMRMLLPRGARTHAVALRSRWFSPIEWLWAGHPPVLVTTSRRDVFFRASRNFIDTARALGIRVEEHVDPRAPHTWQQDTRHPASGAVYAKLRAFVATVTAPLVPAV